MRAVLREASYLVGKVATGPAGDGGAREADPPQTTQIIDDAGTAALGGILPPAAGV